MIKEAMNRIPVGVPVAKSGGLRGAKPTSALAVTPTSLQSPFRFTAYHLIWISINPIIQIAVRNRKDFKRD